MDEFGEVLYNLYGSTEVSWAAIATPGSGASGNAGIVDLRPASLVFDTLRTPPAPVAVDDLVNNDLTVRGSFGYTSSAWRDVVALLNTGRLDLAFLVTHRFALADWKQALDALRGPESPRGKVLLEVRS